MNMAASPSGAERHVEEKRDRAVLDEVDALDDIHFGDAGLRGEGVGDRRSDRGGDDGIPDGARVPDARERQRERAPAIASATEAPTIVTNWPGNAARR